MFSPNNYVDILLDCFLLFQRNFYCVQVWVMEQHMRKPKRRDDFTSSKEIDISFSADAKGSTRQCSPQIAVGEAKLLSLMTLALQQQPTKTRPHLSSEITFPPASRNYCQLATFKLSLGLSISWPRMIHSSPQQVLRTRKKTLRPLVRYLARVSSPMSETPKRLKGLDTRN